MCSIKEIERWRECLRLVKSSVEGESLRSVLPGTKCKNTVTSTFTGAKPLALLHCENRRKMDLSSTAETALQSFLLVCSSALLTPLLLSPVEITSPLDTNEAVSAFHAALTLIHPSQYHLAPSCIIQGKAEAPLFKIHFLSLVLCSPLGSHWPKYNANTTARFGMNCPHRKGRQSREESRW